MVKIWIQLSPVLFILQQCFSANILGIVPTPSHSHQVAFQNFWKELSLRGHKVTLITTDPLDDPSLTNLTEIDLKWSYTYFGNISKQVETTFTKWNAMELFSMIHKAIAEGQLSYGPVQDLMNPEKNHFDIVLVEAFFPDYLGFAEIYKCPRILILSMELMPQIHYVLGNPSHPILNPELLLPYHGKLEFRERVISTIFYWYESVYAYKYWIRMKQEILHKYFGISTDLEKLIADVDMTFINVNPVTHGIRALGPSTITIGGYKRETSVKPLPVDLKEFLDSAKDGFIYFSLGSNVKSKDLRPETLDAIIETLRELPYKVLWKFEADELPGKPDNVKLVKWAPQQSVLAHPNIKLFVTQGGLQSMEEAIYSEVPMVVIPFFGDQEQNAKLMKSKGIALIVEVRPYLKKDELKTAMLEVINNPQYRNTVKRLKELALDMPMSGLEKAVWWTEYVIRNKGAKHLRNPAADIPFYQYYLLDVIGFLLAVAVAIVSIVVFISKRLYLFISSKFVISKLIQEKKIK